MPPIGRNRSLYSDLQDACRAGVPLWVEVSRESVAAAQWEVRGHMEDPAFQRKPSRPIRALRGSRQRCNTGSVARRLAPPQAGRLARPKKWLTCCYEGC